MSRSPITGGVLAGGRGRRMQGRDKGLLLYQGQPLIEQVLARLQPQVGTVLISANRHPGRYAQYGWPVFADAQPGFHGPLAGIAQLLARVETPFLLTVPCDTIGFPESLADTLLARQRATNADLVVAHDGEQAQYLFALYRRELASSAQHALSAGERAVWRWQATLHRIEVTFADAQQAFRNFNCPADLDAAAARQ